jgi:hypothetical protein
MWASFRYKTQLRQLQERQMREYYAQRQSQPLARQSPAPHLVIQSAPYQPQLNDPFAEVSQGSILEDETQRLPEQR